VSRAAIEILQLIEAQVKRFDIPWVNQIPEKKDPYRVLVSCILSLRTKDKVTEKACKALFKVADSPQKMIKLSSQEIEKLIYPVGFFRNKAKIILEVSNQILTKYKGRVPSRLEELLALKGVGPKTANLVLGLGYRIPAVCVDTHVLRISNRLGWVNTKDPCDTQMRLQKIIPVKDWIKLNTILVAFGQNVCKPVSPLCSQCKVRDWCPQRGVKIFR
jgi:endonuclease-3